MTASIIRPCIIALDTSHLGRLAADALSSKKDRRASAQAFQRVLEETGGVLLFCWHHIEELLKHRNQSVLDERIQFLRELPLVARLSSFANEAVPGSIIDVHAFEVEAALKRSTVDLADVRDEAAKKLLSFETGEKLIAPVLENWKQLQTMFWDREERSREVVAISRSSSPSVLKRKAAHLLKQRVRSADQATQAFSEMSVALAEEIQRRGDRRLKNASLTARSFFDDIQREGTASLAKGRHPVLDLLQTFDIEPGDIGPEMTVEEVANLASFRRKLSVINRRLGMPWAELKARAHENGSPAFVIRAALRTYSQNLSEHKGSELVDGYLLCLAPYVDRTYVDRQMLENVRRVRRHCPNLSELLQRVYRAADYSEVANHLRQAVA